MFPSLKEISLMLLTFGLTVIAWIFFRAENIGHALNYIYRLFLGLFNKTDYVETHNLLYWEIGYALPILIIMVQPFGK